MSFRWCFFVAAASLTTPLAAQGDEPDPIEVEFEIFGGVDIVPPDIVESGIAQDRIEGVVGADATATYRLGETRISAGAGTEIYPVDKRYNRHSLSAEVSQDIPLADKGRMQLRLGAGYEYVFGESGRVFDRVSGDAQLIRRHNAEHTTTARLRYAHRNQTEDRFTGFDQDELLLELRHNWRPGGGPGSINASLLWLDINADDDRFSYRGYGVRVIGRLPVSEAVTVYGRASFVSRDYEAPFSPEFFRDRKDDRLQLNGGVEVDVGSSLLVFAEAGYVDNSSNIPVRDFSGAIGLIGLRYTPR